jgi:hypothetical protein
MVKKVEVTDESLIFSGSHMDAVDHGLTSQLQQKWVS